MDGRKRYENATCGQGLKQVRRKYIVLSSRRCLFSDRCYDRVGKETCEWRIINGHDCKAAYMENDCAASCGYCGKD